MKGKWRLRGRVVHKSHKKKGREYPEKKHPHRHGRKQKISSKIVNGRLWKRNLYRRLERPNLGKILCQKSDFYVKKGEQKKRTTRAKLSQQGGRVSIGKKKEPSPAAEKGKKRGLLRFFFTQRGGSPRRRGKKSRWRTGRLKKRS